MAARGSPGRRLHTSPIEPARRGSPGSPTAGTERSRPSGARRRGGWLGRMRRSEAGHARRSAAVPRPRTSAGDGERRPVPPAGTGPVPNGGPIRSTPSPANAPRHRARPESSTGSDRAPGTGRDSPGGPAPTVPRASRAADPLGARPPAARDVAAPPEEAADRVPGGRASAQRTVRSGRPGTICSSSPIRGPRSKVGRAGARRSR